MKSLARATGRVLARQHRSRVARGIAGFCYRVYEHSQNCDGDLRSNGEAELLRRLSPARFRTILDVGANVGEWSQVALGFFPEATIHCFEPIPETAEALHQRLGSRSNVVLNRLGLSDAEGELELHHFARDSGLSSIHRYPHAAGESRSVRCGVVCGDEYLRRHAVEHVDLIKIDVEGSENLVLGGFAQALERGAIDVIQFEYGRMNIVSHFLLYDFHRLLGSHGYAIGKVFPRCVEFRDYAFGDETFLGYNHLAVRKARSDLLALLA